MSEAVQLNCVRAHGSSEALMWLNGRKKKKHNFCKCSTSKHPPARFNHDRLPNEQNGTAFWNLFWICHEINNFVVINQIETFFFYSRFKLKC